MHRTALVFILAAACGGTSETKPNTPTNATNSTAPKSSPAIDAAVNAPDRSAEDRALDVGRHPAELLAFFGIAPGLKVAELGAGGGYTAELLARTVGDSGKLYAVNNKIFLGFANERWTARLATPAMKNVVRVDRELDDPFPPEATNLDAVVMVLVYHDFVAMKVDRDKMNNAVFAALKPGGVYGIVDHSGRVGSGEQDVANHHRIEQSVVVADVTKAGFKLESEGQFLHNPSDTRDWNDSPHASGDKRGTSDRFVLRFVKPR